MSTIVIPAIRAKMGSTSYYQAILRADELARTVQAAMDFVEFESFMESEKMQRSMNERRVEEQIVPYLCRSPDRFFGSVIVLAYRTEIFEFTPWEEFHQGKLPAAMKEVSQRSGVLEISGGQLFALDGQHRLHALRTVVSGEEVTRHTRQKIEGPHRSEVKNDEISAIFVPFESTVKARRIFNKVNRYAKPTSHSTNILTSEDDGYAILTRCLVGVDDPDKFGGRDIRPLDLRSGKKHLIEFEKSSLSTGSPMLTTLETVYNTVKVICSATGHPDLDEKKNVVRPSDRTLADAYDDCAEWWELLMTGFKPFSRLREYPTLIEGARHMDRKFSLVFRPKGLEAFVNGLANAHRRTGWPISKLLGIADRIPLQLNSSAWLGIMVGYNGKMITKQAKLASDLIAYLLVGSTYSALEVSSLQQAFRQAKKDGGYPGGALPASRG